MNLRHSDIPHEQTRLHAAYYFLTAELWRTGGESPDLSTEALAALAFVPRDWWELVTVEAPPSAANLLKGFGEGFLSTKTVRRTFDAQHPAEAAVLPWRRGPDGKLYPAHPQRFAILVDNLIELLPDASDRALARLVGCSHRTVARRRT